MLGDPFRRQSPVASPSRGPAPERVSPRHAAASDHENKKQGLVVASPSRRGRNRHSALIPTLFFLSLILLYSLCTLYWVSPPMLANLEVSSSWNHSGFALQLHPTSVGFAETSSTRGASPPFRGAAKKNAIVASRGVPHRFKRRSRPSLDQVQQGASRRRGDCHPVPYVVHDKNNENDDEARMTVCGLVSVPNSPYQRPNCRFSPLVLHHDLIHATNKGGEHVQAVWGQGEDAEEVSYEPGAIQSFVVPTAQVLLLDKLQQEQGNVESLYYMNQVLDAWQPLSADTAINTASDTSTLCSDTVQGLTLFIKRYEYANLFHSLTDWWNTWNEMDAFQRTFNVSIAGVVLLDAHPQGSLDSVWGTLFGHMNWVNHLLPSSSSLVPTTKKTTTTCYEHAVLVPAGYVNELFRPPAHSDDLCPNPALMADFVEFFLDRFGLTNVTKIPKTLGIIDRKQYKAHPRKNLHSLERAIDNWDQVTVQIQQALPELDIRTFVFEENVPFRQQMQSIRECEVIIGNHGAGLTHLLFLDTNDTHVIEFQHANGHMFQVLAAWKEGVTHRFLPTVKKNRIEPDYLHEHLLPLLIEIFRPPQD